MATRRRTFGTTRRLPSGNVQARYVCPAASSHPVNPISPRGEPYPAPHTAHTTFATMGDADTWLAGIRSDIAREKFTCPIEAAERERARRLSSQTFKEYAEPWLANRRKSNGDDLTPRTKRLYRSQLDELLQTFGDVPLSAITRPMVRRWWTVDLPTAHPDRKTGNAHAYALLRTILGSAVDEELLPLNPANIKGAGSTKRDREVLPATIPELVAIADAAPERFRVAVLLAGWCALRFGEVFELRRRDLAPGCATIAVQRGLTSRQGSLWVGPPKANSRRTVAVPPHLRAELAAHVDQWAQPGPDGLLFAVEKPRRKGCSCGYAECVGGHVLNSMAYKWYAEAREAAGRPDLRFHDLRHTGLTLASLAGAGLADLMALAGHRSVQVAEGYMHATQSRRDEIAAAMSKLPGVAQ